MIVDRAECLIFQRGGSKVIHEAGSSAGALSVPGIPRSRTTLVADGSSAILMFGGRGRTMRMVACSAIREVPERRRRDHHGGRAGQTDPSSAAPVRLPARAFRSSCCGRFHMCGRSRRTSPCETIGGLRCRGVDADLSSTDDWPTTSAACCPKTATCPIATIVRKVEATRMRAVVVFREDPIRPLLLIMAFLFRRLARD